jgi:hypothetical protein
MPLVVGADPIKRWRAIIKGLHARRIFRLLWSHQRYWVTYAETTDKCEMASSGRRIVITATNRGISELRDRHSRAVGVILID